MSLFKNSLSHAGIDTVTLSGVMLLGCMWTPHTPSRGEKEGGWGLLCDSGPLKPQIPGGSGGFIDHWGSLESGANIVSNRAKLGGKKAELVQERPQGRESVCTCVCVRTHTGDRLTASVCTEWKASQRAAAPNIRYLNIPVIDLSLLPSYDLLFSVVRVPHVCVRTKPCGTFFSAKSKRIWIRLWIAASSLVSG